MDNTQISSSEARHHALLHLPSYLAHAGQKERLNNILSNFIFLQAKIDESGEQGPELLIEDYNYEQGEDFKLIQEALQLASPTLRRDKTQLASQLLGRLTSGAYPFVQRLLEQAKQWREQIWLRPIIPSLTPSGTPLIRSLQNHISPIFGLAISPDGRLAISTSLDHTATIWDFVNWTVLRVISFNGLDPSIAAFTTNGRCFILSSYENELLVWNLEGTSPVHILRGHKDLISDVAVMPDGVHAVSASIDQTIRIWNIEKGILLFTLRGHIDKITSIAAIADGQRFITASSDKTLKIWDRDKGLELITLYAHTAEVTSVVVTSDGTRAISGSADGILKIWDLARSEALHTLSGHSVPVSSIAITLDNKYLCSAAGKVIKIWDMNSGDELSTLKGHSNGITKVVCSPDGKKIVSSSADRTIKIWDLGKIGNDPDSAAHTDRVTGATFTRDGIFAITASRDDVLQVWHVETGTPLLTQHCDFGDLAKLILSPFEPYIVSIDRIGNQRVWDPFTGKELSNKLYDSLYYTADRSVTTPDGRRSLFKGISSNEVIFYDHTESEEKPYILQGHDKATILAIAITPDGRLGVSASFDQKIILWDLDNKVAKSVFYGDSALTACDIALDSMTILAGEDSGRVHFLQLEGVRKSLNDTSDKKFASLNAQQLLAAFQQSLLTFSEDVTFYKTRGYIYASHNEYEQALTDFNYACELDPNDFTLYLMRGTLFASSRQYKQALVDLDQAILLNPKSDAAYILRGDIYLSSNVHLAFNKAIDDYSSAIILDSKNIEAYIKRGQILGTLELYQDAKADYDRVIELDPQNLEALEMRRYIYLQLGEFQLALADATHVIDLYPNDSEAYIARGYVYMVMGKTKQARADYQKALKLDPQKAQTVRPLMKRIKMQRIK